ncbi:subclass B3 metallo-beta-lactamase [Duganella sp. FT3S]|uniref:Subclass B3 metallo-beta-lactamase n=1 Tax=Rugamonas fusca TaxID=2758568 RepID=A0A7W2EEY1_9BURK|nr:subclass B3 metallo-beta-lactamase [Rugamonas fusca]MBA5604665.1 subclass B3 metallo-beta-lactamase [Rugamonas fusca]
MSSSPKKQLARALSACAALLATLAGAPAAHADTWDDWNKPVAPFKIYGDSYYVGVQGLSAVLVTSPQGHILIDGAFPESAQHIADSVRALGFRVEDIKYILNSHAHVDHAGGIAELQRMSGATVLAGPSAAAALQRGKMGPDDPQYKDTTPYPPVTHVGTVHDGEVVALGANRLTARYTPGHTQGGVSWTWEACEQQQCAAIVYADSINAISSDDFKFSDNARYPNVVQDLQHSFAVLEGLRCDIMVAVHPGSGDLWEKMAKANGKPHALLGDPGACKQYVAEARKTLARRLDRERSAQ